MGASYNLRSVSAEALSRGHSVGRPACRERMANPHVLGFLNPVVWAGFDTLKSGRRIRVWSCEVHREGVRQGQADYRGSLQATTAKVSTPVKATSVVR
jgi:hypothetical protein